MPIDDAPHVPPPNPAFGPLCERCGTTAKAGDHAELCWRLSDRPQLWADGWVDLNAFGLRPISAVGWPEVTTGPTAQVVEGGLGAEAFVSRAGPWVRAADPSVPTSHRVAALTVLRAAGVPIAPAVATVLTASSVRIASWLAPRALAIRTTGCGDVHHVRIDRGLPPTLDRCRASARDRGEILWRFRSAATCDNVVTRWRSADIGTIQLDVSLDPAHRYRRVGHDEGVTAAFRVFVAATLARVRIEAIAAGEPDRWLHLVGEPAPIGSPAQLHESTRALPMALITAPPTWLWSPDPLE